MSVRMMISLVFLAIAILPAVDVRAQEHSPAEWLRGEVGEWKIELKIMPPREGGEPIVFEAREVNELFGENWIVSNFEGEFGGHPFKGHGVYGFDLKRNCYIATWVDSVNGFMSRYEGQYDPASKSVVMLGQEIDPNSGELVEGKQVRSADGDRRTIVSFQKFEGDDDFTKAMEVRLTRIK